MKKIDINEKIEIYESRVHKIVKHNDIIQKSRFKLSVVEQKAVAFIVSLVKPKEHCLDNIQPLEYEFDIQTYCKICGIDYNNGNNYKNIRDTLKSLRDKSVIITLIDETETTVSWINKFWSNKRSGKVKIRFDEDIIPYIFDLYENTTRYELLNILPMQSKYAIRLYEICRSWAGIHSKTYDVDELRKMLMIPENELVRYPDFRRYVIDKAISEINDNVSDINVSYEPITKGRKVIKIRFDINYKTSKERYIQQDKINKILDGE